MKKIIFVFAFIFGIINNSYSALVEATGEAEITANDVTAAKNIAISRAKWAALEKVSEVKIKLDTIISNAELIDEGIKTELSGVIKSYKITDEGRKDNIYWVSINADIEEDNAKDLINDFSKNTSIAIVIPPILSNGNTVDTAIFNSEVVKKLVDNGFQVIDILQEKNINADVNNAIKNNNYDKLKSLTSKYMVNTFLIGNINVVSKGKNVGYANIDFSIVTGDLTWKLLYKKDNSMVVIDSGSSSARGQGATEIDAINNLLRNMSKNNAVKLSSIVSEKILGVNEKKVIVTIKNDKNLRYLKELKEDLRNIPFILNIEDNGLNSVVVNYPEKTYHLALFLAKNNKYRLIKIEDNELIIERR